MELQGTISGELATLMESAKQERFLQNLQQIESSFEFPRSNCNRSEAHEPPSFLDRLSKDV